MAVRARLDIHPSGKLGAYRPQSRFTSRAPKACSLKEIQETDHVYANGCEHQPRMPSVTSEEGNQRDTHETNKR
jgi:hypothetical protein